MFTLIIAVFSLAIAIISFVLSLKKYQRDGFAQSYLSNENHMIEIESRIGQHPRFLRFHGIENPEELLAGLDIDSEDFAYLVNSFTAGAIYYNTASQSLKGIILAPGSYRWRMCKSPAVKKAWPAIKVLLAAGEYRDRLESLINE